MRKRLVITGMGAVTPLGLNVESHWNALIAGKCGIRPISRFDASALPVRIAAEVENFDPANLLSSHTLRSSSLFMQYALAAAREALDQAALCENFDPHRAGVCMGTALAGIDDASKCGLDYEKSSTGKISPHLVPRIMGNMANAHLSIQNGFHGPSLSLGTACAAGGDALMSAAMLILADEADIMTVLGGESIITPPIVSSLAQAKALSRRNDDPADASRPFDMDRDGFVIGEGGGALVLESEEHALKRGAPILAELAGWGNTQDGYHITAPDPTGNGAALCMRRALNRAGLKPEELDYINAHGTSTQLGDRAETRAIKSVFGPPGQCPPVSSTKGATGHLMGAGALTELIGCVKAIGDGILPPTLNLHNPDPECDLDYVPNHAREASVNAAMSNALGFGGQNSCIIVRRYQ